MTNYTKNKTMITTENIKEMSELSIDELFYRGFANAFDEKIQILYKDTIEDVMEEFLEEWKMGITQEEKVSMITNLNWNVSVTTEED